MLDPESVADGLGLELIGTVADEPGLVLAAERGDPPGRSARSPLAQLARSLLQQAASAGRGRADRGAGVITADEPVDLDPIRDRLAALGRAPTPADVAAAMRAEGLMVSDATLIETVEALRRHSVGAGPLDPLLHEPGVTDILVNGPDQRVRRTRRRAGADRAALRP